MRRRISIRGRVRPSIRPVLFSKVKNTHTRRILCCVSGLAFFAHTHTHTRILTRKHAHPSTQYAELKERRRFIFKEEAMEKMERMVTRIGYPSFIKDDEKLEEYYSNYTFNENANLLRQRLDYLAHSK